MSNWIDQVDNYLDTVPVSGQFTVADFYQWLPAGDDDNAGFRLQRHRSAQGQPGRTRNFAYCEQRGPYAYWVRVTARQYNRVRNVITRQGIEDLMRAFACEARAAASTNPSTLVVAETEINAVASMLNAALGFMGQAPVAVP